MQTRASKKKENVHKAIKESTRNRPYISKKSTNPTNFQQRKHPKNHQQQIHKQTGPAKYKKIK